MNTVASFPYIPVMNSVVGRLFEPVVDVTLTLDRKHVNHRFFLGSGADISLIPDYIGRTLGLRRQRRRSAQAVSFVGEGSKLNIVELHLQIGSARIVSVRFGWADNNEVPPLLGRLDVFEHFTFKFNHEQSLVIVRQ